jgi:DNA-binding NarL/FixJ family response regulator
MNKVIRILIADNNPDYARPLEQYLNEQGDFQVVGAVRDGEGALQAYKECLPDLVLIDLHLPVLDSIRTIKALMTDFEGVHILGVSDLASDRYAVEAVKAGAQGYIKKDPHNYAEIAGAVRQIAAGEVVLTSTLASHILQEFS